MATTTIVICNGILVKCSVLVYNYKSCSLAVMLSKTETQWKTQRGAAKRRKAQQRLKWRGVPLPVRLRSNSAFLILGKECDIIISSQNSKSKSSPPPPPQLLVLSQTWIEQTKMRTAVVLDFYSFSFTCNYVFWWLRWDFGIHFNLCFLKFYLHVSFRWPPGSAQCLHSNSAEFTNWISDQIDLPRFYREAG